MCRKIVLGLGALILLAGCGGSSREPDTDETSVAEAAARLARESLVIDSHIDVPYRLQEEAADISQRTDGGDFDYPRAVEGGLNAAFMSIYVPASYQESGGAKDLADSLIDMVEGFEAASPDKFMVARSSADVERAMAAGRIALPMGMENGAPIENDLGNLRHFFARGIRYITLTHSKNNQICDSSYDEEPTWNGLSPFGREVVAEMNRLGIMIDVSHVSDETFDQVVELSSAPVIASHSSCRHYTPGWERNMSDESIRKLAENGGVIQINFGSAFLTEVAYRWMLERGDAVDAFAAERGLESSDPAVAEFRTAYNRENPMPLATVEDVADHIDHVVELVGIDHVGLGSDFDGVGPSLPEGLKDVSEYPNLFRVLLERGYSEEDVRKVAAGNLMRVWREVEGRASAVASVTE
jgi:membrane dipeptidase